MRPERKARLAGLLYLVCIVSGFFAEFFVRDKIVVYSDPTVTAAHLLAAPWLYRLGFLADVVSFTTGILIALLFYELFRPVSRSAARLALKT
jgi:hypothetical protein